ncbi:MAG: acyltransferase [Bacteroidaceae bacterium]|nr:acyltransferase [Bacteroidaceae bacterium]
MEGNYNAIDVVKVLMACVVVAIHTHPESDLDNLFVSKIVECLYSIAVPFFFVVSGFFLSNKIKGHDYETKISYIQRWLSRIVRLYLIWTLIYLPYAVYGFIRDDLSWGKTLLVYFRNVILVGENFLSWPLWYLLAMIVSGCIFYIMIKFRIKEGYMLGIALCLAVICPFIETLRSTELGDLYFSLFKTTRNGFFVGFPYMMIGYLMIKPRYREYNVCWTFLLLLISFVLMMNDVPMANFVAVYALVAVVSLMDQFAFFLICKII